MDGTDTGGFGGLLRHYRLTRGLTQEALAEHAGLGVRSIQHLERGETHPQRATAHRLAAALGLSADQRAAFAALAHPIPRRRTVSATPTPPSSAARTPRDGAHPAPIALVLAQGEDAVCVAQSTSPRGAHNLPAPLTSFIGREEDLVAVTRLLHVRRLVTLTGAGGCGKTRLGLQLAAGLVERYAAGVWLAELAPLADPAGVLVAVASAVGIREEPGQPLLSTLLAALRPRHLLLLLDNCEHLLDACAALVEALLRACPKVTILVTSREALGLAGETIWRVPSLPVPDARQLPPLEALARVEAVRLFIERAQAVQPHFALTAHNAALVAQICRRLDGIPLAIELAAARLRGLSLEHLADRLDARFRLLTGGSRTALPRQQTLQATVDWSYSLLSMPEQILFTRLAIFSGGFSLEAVEAVCAGGPLATEAVLDLLLRLVDRSLVTVEERAGDVERYRLLETLRQYGRERLPAGGEVEDLSARHAAYYRTLAEEAEQRMSGAEQATWIDRLDAEQINIREALRWALTMGAAQEGMRLAGALRRYWHYRGYMAEGAQSLTELLALPEAAARTRARASALTGLAELRGSTRMLDGLQTVSAETRAFAAEAASIARETGDKLVLAQALVLLGWWIAPEDYPAGRTMLEECLALFRELDVQRGVQLASNRLGDAAWEQGDTAGAHRLWSDALRLARHSGNQDGIAVQLGDLGMMAYHERDYATARSQMEESLALYRAAHKHNLVALALGCLGAVARGQGDTVLARTCYEEKLAFWRNVGDRTGIAATLAELGALAKQEEDHTQAHALFEEALTLRRELGDGAGVAASLAHLGDLACAQGDYARSATLYREGLDVLRTAGERAATAACLEGLAAIAVADGCLERAARLYGAAATQSRGAFVLNVWDDPVARDRQVAAVRGGLNDEAWATAWAEGEAMTPAEAIAYAKNRVSG